MIYKVIKDINLILDGEDTIIPEGTLLYRIPGDHMGNNVSVDYYSWNGETIELDKDNNFLYKM